MAWWRAYDEAADDPKLQMLPDALFRAWFNLMCLASRNKGILPPISSVSFSLRKPEQEASEIIVALHKVGLFDETKRGWEPHNWLRRQYKSDVSTERVKQFRKRQTKRFETVSRNGPETEQRQSRAETERTEAKASVGTPRKERQHGRSGTRLPDDWQITPDLADYARDRGLDPGETAAAFKDHWAASNSRTAIKRDWGAAFRTWCRRASADAGSRMGDSHPRAVRPARGNDAAFEHLALLAAQGRGGGDGDDRT